LLKGLTMLRTPLFKITIHCNFMLTESAG